MKTLPNAIIAGIHGDSERVVLVRIIPESGDTWGELLWATRNITVTDWEDGVASKSFAGGVLAEGGLGTIKQSVDIRQGGNVAKVSGLTLTICNPEYNGEDRFDQIFTDNLENREVEIRLVFWTGSNPAWSDTLLLYKGVIEDVTFDYETYQIKIKDAGFKRHKEISDLILTEDAYDEIPEYNKGKVVPLLYGTLHPGALYLSDYSMCPIIRSNKNKEQFIISRNKIKSGAAHSTYLYFSDVNRMAFLFVDSGEFTFNYERPSFVSFPLNVNIKAKFYSQLEKQGTKTDPTTLDFKNAVDQSIDTYFTLESSQKLYLKVPIPAKFGEIINEGSNLRLKATFGTVSGTGRVKYYNPTWDDGAGGFSTGITLADFISNDYNYSIGDDKTAHGKHPTQDDQYNSWEWDELSVLELGIEMDAESSAQIKNIWLYINNMVVFSTSVISLVHSEVGVPLYFGYFPRKAKPDFMRQMENILSNVDGADFGSWIGEDSRTNGYTTDDLIEYGAYIIEAILRDELGLTSSEIDYDSFDNIGNDTDGERKDWKFATRIDSSINSLKIITEFCRQAGIIFFQDYQNKEKVVTLTKKTATKTIDRTTIQQDSIKIDLSELGDIFNEFYVNYSKSLMSDNFRKTLYITASDHNLSSNARTHPISTYTGLCSDSQSRYNHTKRLTIDCDWINDDATAELFIKWLAEWFCYRKRIVPFDTDGLDHIDLEMGDQVKIDHTLLPTGISNDASFLLFDVAHDLDNDRMKFEFMQIPDLLP